MKKETPEVKPALLSRKNAAVYLAVTVRTIDTLATSGRIKRVRIGGKTLFSVAELDEFIRENTEAVQS